VLNLYIIDEILIFFILGFKINVNSPKHPELKLGFKKIPQYISMGCVIASPYILRPTSMKSCYIFKLRTEENIFARRK
jgi:hypothetical protein